MRSTRLMHGPISQCHHFPGKLDNFVPRTRCPHRRRTLVPIRRATPTTASGRIALQPPMWQYVFVSNMGAVLLPHQCPVEKKIPGRRIGWSFRHARSGISQRGRPGSVLPRHSSACCPVRSCRLLRSAPNGTGRLALSRVGTAATTSHECSQEATRFLRSALPPRSW